METLGLAGRVRIVDLPEDVLWPKHEVIDGSLLVTPAPGRRHQAVVGRVFMALVQAAPAGVVVYPGANVRRVDADGEADLLTPDVVVLRAGGQDAPEVLDPTHLDPEEVAVAVEVVSPSTRTTDTVTKREAYAAWGVPAFLVVDPASSTLTRHGDTAGVRWAVDAVAGVLPA